LLFKLVFWSNGPRGVQLHIAAGARLWSFPCTREHVDQWRLCAVCQVSSFHFVKANFSQM